MRLLGQKDMKHKLKGVESYCHNSAPWFSKVTFYWLTPLLTAGYVNPLEVEDLGQLPDKETAAVQFEKFNLTYCKEKVKTNIKLFLF